MGRHARAKNMPVTRAEQTSLAALDPYNRALEAIRSKNLPAAILLLRQSILQKPTHFAAYYNLALALAEQGNFVEAVQASRAAIELQPYHVQARVNLAETLRQLRQLAEAFAVCEQALAIDRKSADTFCIRGLIRNDAGDLNGGIGDLRTAVKLKKNSAFAHKTLGRMLRDADRKDEARQNLEIARQLNPDDAELLRLLADLNSNLGNLKQAFEDYRRSIELNPYDGSTQANLAGMLCHTGQFELAISVASVALKLAPNLMEAHANLATAYEMQGKNLEAVTAYADALKQKPDDGKSLMSMCRLLRQDCDWESLTVSESLAQSLTYKKGQPTSPFGILNLVASPADILQCCKLWAASMSKDCGPDLAVYAPRPLDRRAERLRIGYLSADFHVHATAALIAEVLELHDKSKFETFGYSIGAHDTSPMRQRLVASLDHFVELNKSSHAEAAAHIRADEIDILVDLKGYTYQARPQIMAWRPAPIQVNFLGFPGTMGASFIDYVLADPVVAPMDHQYFYTEKLVHLPDTYQPNDRNREISANIPSRKDCGLPEDAFVFCCFNSTHKLHETFFSIWMRLLAKNDGSVLWLLESNSRVAANLRREVEAAGVDPARLIFAPKLKLADHLARMKLADLFLDTSPYGAHTTASEALWTGLPVLTCLGDAFPARVGASLLTAIGLPELITTSIADYEVTANRLVKNADEMQAIRAKLARHIPTKPLFDAPLFTRNLEKAFARMAELRDAGEGPESFAV